jgi:hypothetical protein
MKQKELIVDKKRKITEKPTPREKKLEREKTKREKEEMG